MIETQQENGRSMVEIIGVLAVMGVLSIGALIGYRSALDKQRANTLINDASKRALVYSQQMLSGVALSDQEFPNQEIAGYSFVRGILEGEKQRGFFIEPQSVSVGVCRHIADAQWRVPYASYVVHGDDTFDVLTRENCSAGANADGIVTLSFEFAEDLNNENLGEVIPEASCTSDADCSENGCAYCKGGQCWVGCRRYHICSTETQSCVLSCPESMIESDNTCVCNTALGWQDDGVGGCECVGENHCCPANHYWRESKQKCQDWDTCWVNDGTGQDTWNDEFFQQCQEGCPEGQFYRYSSYTCYGPTRKGRCVDLDSLGNIREPVYNATYDQKGANNLGTGSLLGEAEALRLTSHMIVSENTSVWFNIKNWCLAQGGRLATFEDMDCLDAVSQNPGGGRCTGSRIVQALMALYGAQPKGKDAFFLQESDDGFKCEPYHIWSEEGSYSTYGNRAFGSAALCIMN